MSGRLRGKRVAILVEEGFDAREVADPMAALREEGAETVLVGASAGAYYRDRNGGPTVTADLAASAARVHDFDAIVIPGGFAPDRMRMRHAMVDLAAAAMAANKPVAAICRGAQVLISADAIRGRTLTCWPSIAVDVKNAGGLYVDRPVVRDGNLITSRKADDLAAFTTVLIDALLAF
ncbi:MAG: type 1 glutamine amidotransferase domain-containing protein [Acidobacteriota bacterium]